jgi:hypothetical protein
MVDRERSVLKGSITADLFVAKNLEKRNIVWGEVRAIKQISLEW